LNSGLHTVSVRKLSVGCQIFGQFYHCATPPSLPINITSETHVPFPQQDISTHSKTQNSIKLRCKTPRQTNTPVRPRQHW